MKADPIFWWLRHGVVNMAGWYVSLLILEPDVNVPSGVLQVMESLLW